MRIPDREPFDDVVPPGSLGRLLGEGDALLVVPPFAQSTITALSPHVLQACARAAGFEVRVLYANLLFARLAGPAWYDAFCRQSSFDLSLPGERVFARVAHGLPTLGRHARHRYRPDVLLGPDKARDVGAIGLVHPPVRRIPERELRAADAVAEAFVDRLAEALSALRFPVVGCTASFDQTNAGIALLRALKRRRPDIVTLLGGANCDGEMAHGIVSLDPLGEALDHVFSGESERTFTACLAGLREGRRPPDRIVEGTVCPSLDDVPPPRYDEYDRQIATFLPDHPTGVGQRDLTVEASRGCFRGEKGTCTFCGLNGPSRTFRRKSPERTAADVVNLARRHPERMLCFSDNILPPAVLAPLRAADHRAPLLACVSPRVSLEMAVGLRDAGFAAVTPGIESLDTDLLRRMNKGSVAADNVLALRYLRSAGVHPFWNLLWGFPGEEEGTYTRTLALLPLLHHLPPPRAVYHLSIDRFSPYHSRPGHHGIRAMRPLPAYRDAFPRGADTDRLAAHFLADYPCAGYRRPDLVRALLQAVDAWCTRWSEAPPPMLAVLPLGDRYAVRDTRGLPGRPGMAFVTAAQARDLLAPRPMDRRKATLQAIRDGLAVALDGRFVPLATASTDVLCAFEIPSKTLPSHRR